MFRLNPVRPSPAIAQSATVGLSGGRRSSGSSTKSAPVGGDYENFYPDELWQAVPGEHEPRQDFTIPYELPHRANGYSGSGVWYFRTEPIWSPEPHLRGIIATECTTDKVISGFRIETIINFLKENEDLLRR